MAKAPYKLPNVFVGCPYGGRFKFSTFKSALDRIPFKWFYADTSLATKQLLGILRSYITAADFCIFDISLWNPNVALEIGVADGLGAEYYILLDRRLSKGVPADIQGIQRIEYASVKGMNKGDLVPSIVHYLVKEHTHPRNIWDGLSNPNRDRKYYLALGMLAHLRDHKRLTGDDVRRLARGTYLRKEAQDQVLDVLAEIGLLGNRQSAKGATLRKNLYKEDISTK
jgi:hypothetical protein